MAPRDILLTGQPAEAARLILETEPDGWNIGDHDATTLSLLMAALTGTDVNADAAVGTLTWHLVAQLDREDGPWVYRFPDELTQHLVASPEPLDTIASRWGEAELLEHFSHQELTSFVQQLRNFLLDARAQSATVLYWSCA